MTPKFRAFDKSTGERFFVTDVDWDEERLIVSPEQPPARYGPWHDRKFDAVIFEQSTGLTDANGVEIFEGDYIDVTREGGDGDFKTIRCLIEWVHGEAVFAEADYGELLGSLVSYAEDVRVVGQHDYREDA